jgi:hypothetical protein
MSPCARLACDCENYRPTPTDQVRRWPETPVRVTVSGTRTGARTLKVITSLNGKPFDEEEWEVSQDGNTYTYKQYDGTSSKPALIILHRMDTH